MARERIGINSMTTSSRFPQKPLETLSPADLGVDTAPRLKTLKVAETAARKAGIKVGSVAELVDKLRNEAKVI